MFGESCAMWAESEIEADVCVYVYIKDNKASHGGLHPDLVDCSSLPGNQADGVAQQRV